jgi:hypothetical protein
MFQVLEPEFDAARWDVSIVRSDDRGASENSKGSLAFLDPRRSCRPVPRLEGCAGRDLVAAMKEMR